MPLNKNAYIRYQAIDRCLRNRYKRYYFGDLKEAVEQALIAFNGEESCIGRTQLYKDLSFMESVEGFGADIERITDGRKKYFRYADPDFSINQRPVKEQEVEAIKEAMAVLQRFKGLPQFDWLEEWLPALQDRLQVEGDSTPAIILFEDNLDYAGRAFIEPLYHHIRNKNVLSILYQDFKAEAPYEIILHPYILKQYNQRWFLFGKNEENGIMTWNMALDRIKDIQVEPAIAYEECTLDWEEDYFYDIIGVTRYPEQSLEKISLRCSSDIARYIQTKPLHPSQRVIEQDEDGSMVIEIRIYRNKEYEAKIRQFEGMEELEAVHLE